MLAFRSVFIICIFSYFLGYAQDLEQIGVKKGIKATGGVSANQVFYYSDGINARRDPYNYFLTGNVNLSLYGISLPFSFSFSNQRFGYGQPFNILGVSPKYKWVTAHLGWRSMTFSPYTLNGHSFLGAGLEIEPVKKWKTSLMYGRLLKATEPDLTFSNRPSYMRIGMGIKTELTGKAGTIGISAFTAKDEVSSISKSLDQAGIAPQQNVVIGLSGAKTIQKLTLNFEAARSAITTDLRSPLKENAGKSADVDFFGKQRTSTAYYNAFKGNATFQFTKFSIGAGYERIDPNYKTLGAYYFNNDLRNITGNFSTSLFQNKISFSTNIGGQRDNLDNNKIATMRRLVGSANLGFTPNQKWNISLGYSNFQSFANINPQIKRLTALTPYDNLDTLNYVQISQSMQGSVMHILTSTAERNSTVSVSGSLQQSGEKRGESNSAGPTFYNANAAYGLNFLKMKFNIYAGFNTNISGLAGAKTTFLGPSVGGSKTLWKDKLRTGVGVTWNNIIVNSVSTSKVWNISQNNTLTLAKKHNVNLNTVYVNMSKPAAGQVSIYTRAINEVTVTLGYGYTF